ncbi:unnamed protein product [Calypogeia fissa]
MRVSNVCAGCYWRPPTDVGPQVWVINHLTKILFSYVLRSDFTVNYKLLNFVTTRVPAQRNSKNGVDTVDITLDASTGVWCRVFVPTWVDSSKKLPIMLYFHGGGFALFSPDLKEYDAHCRHLSKRFDVIVVSVAYRLAPEHKRPAAYEDGFMALEWVKSQANAPNEDFPSKSADFSKVFLAGDSAGGNLAHHVAVRAGASDLAPISVVGIILLQPFFGGMERTVSEIQYKNGTLNKLDEMDWYWRAFLPSGEDRDHPSSNVCGPKSPAFLSMNLSKILVIAGGKDPLRDRQIQYAEAMQSAGKECKLALYEKAFHGFYLFRGVKATTLLYDELDEFINPATEGRNSSVAGPTAANDTPKANNASFLTRMMSW